MFQLTTLNSDGFERSIIYLSLGFISDWDLHYVLEAPTAPLRLAPPLDCLLPRFYTLWSWLFYFIIIHLRTTSKHLIGNALLWMIQQSQRVLTTFLESECGMRGTIALIQSIWVHTSYLLWSGFCSLLHIALTAEVFIVSSFGCMVSR